MTSKDITVQGVIVNVSQPYVAGHVISEAEAKALNQVRAENIGNNVRKQITDLLAANNDDKTAVREAAQALVAEKDAAYVFTMASVGGGREPLDPLAKECRAVAKEFLSSKLKEKGITQKQYVEANGEDAYKSKIVELAEHPEIVKVAKKRLAARDNLAGLDAVSIG